MEIEVTIILSMLLLPILFLIMKNMLLLYMLFSKLIKFPTLQLFDVFTLII